MKENISLTTSIISMLIGFMALSFSYQANNIASEYNRITIMIHQENKIREQQYKIMKHIDDIEISIDKFLLKNYENKIISDGDFDNILLELSSNTKYLDSAVKNFFETQNIETHYSEKIISHIEQLKIEINNIKNQKSVIIDEYNSDPYNNVCLVLHRESIPKQIMITVKKLKSSVHQLNNI